jgi:subtilisin family serine protease
LSLIFISIFTSCISQTDNGSRLSDSEKNPDSYVPTAPIIYSADYIINEYQQHLIPTAEDIIGQTLPSNPKFRKVQGPDWLLVDANSGEITIDTVSNQAPINFKVEAYDDLNPLSVVQSSLKSIAVNGDPLRYQQWHIQNDGYVKTYSLRDGEAGVDLNLTEVYKAGITGNGVKIAISDSGGEINHDDFVGNILSGAHRDYTLDSPYIGKPTPTNAHGTAVGGIIAARGWNNKGGTGIAPFGKLGFFQFLKSSQSPSILIDQASGDFDIFNYSYGDTLLFDTKSDENYLDHLKYQTISNRKFYLKAAGNEYALSDGNLCAPHNANAPFENESPYIIIVGAVDANGEKAQYANVGSNLWVSAPGGDYGSTDPAILTTDLPTCFKGYSVAGSYQVNDFEYGHHENINCNYTSVMNGTSASAPMVSGVIALILEANPSLSYREVKHILAMTSTKIDPNHSNTYGVQHPSRSFVGCTDLSLTDHEYEQGWVKNNADIWFNNFYGFGMVNAAAAVSLAQNFNQPAIDTLGWLPMSSPQIETNPNFSSGAYATNSTPIAIKDDINDSSQNVLGTSKDIVVNYSGDLKLESLTLEINVTHPHSGEVGVEITSPSGTKSILQNINNSFLLDDDANLKMKLTSHAFYGERINGTWTVRVIDGRPGNIGTFNQAIVNFIGHQ